MNSPEQDTYRELHSNWDVQDKRVIHTQMYLEVKMWVALLEIIPILLRCVVNACKHQQKPYGFSYICLQWGKHSLNSMHWLDTVCIKTGKEISICRETVERPLLLSCDRHVCWIQINELSSQNNMNIDWPVRNVNRAAVGNIFFS